MRSARSPRRRRSRRLPGAGLAILALLPASSVAAQEPPRVSPAGIARSPIEGGERLDLVLPGVLLGATALPAGEGYHPGRLLLLVGGEGDPDAAASLWLLDPREGTLERAAAGLPAGAKAVEVMDLDGDGAGELLLGRLGDLFSLGSLDRPGAEGAPRRVLSHPGFDLRSLSPGLLRRARRDLGHLAVAEVGRVRLYEADSRGGLRLVRELPLPVRAAREEAGLRLASPPVAVLPGEAGQGPLLAAGPEAHGRRRLRTVLLEPEGAGGEDAGGAEAWSLLPGPEVVEQSWYARVDGRPVLFVATQSADRIGIFEKRRLRVFPLSADRTREGRRPSLEVETRSRRWFEMDLEVRDFDGDGRDDLLLVQPEGLGGGELLLEVFPGIGSGRFLARTEKTKLEVGAEGWSFGGDVDGDGLPDLAVVTGEALAVYPGSPSKRRLVEKTPRWTVPLTGLAGTERRVVVGEGGADEEGESDGGGEASVEAAELEVLDLDGDGRSEVLLLTRSGCDGRGRLTLLRSAM